MGEGDRPFVQRGGEAQAAVRQAGEIVVPAVGLGEERHGDGHGVGERKGEGGVAELLGDQSPLHRPEPEPALVLRQSEGGHTHLGQRLPHRVEGGHLGARAMPRLGA